MTGIDGGWILPSNVYPEDEICITLRIPNEPKYISAFWGALYELTFWNNWQRDTDHTGRLVAGVWKEIWLREVGEYSGEMCPLMDVRQNPENPCTLEKTTDGLIWEPFANIRLCPPQLRQRGNRFEYSTDGLTWYTVPDGDYEPGYNDPPPNPRPPTPPGQDECCLAAANAENAIYLTYADLSPEWPIVPGFEAILGADVANFLHLLIGPLYDAFEFGIKLLTAFIAGVIFDIGTYTEEVREQLRTIICENITVTDSVPSIDFSAVVSEVGGLGGGVWSGINTILAMIGPSGLNLAAATTAVTEADCGDCNCSGDVWCYTWDFKTGTSDWENTEPYGIWVSGQGWRATSNAPGVEGLLLSLDFGTPTEITELTLTVNYSASIRNLEAGFDPMFPLIDLNPVNGVSSPQWLGATTGVGLAVSMSCGTGEYAAFESVTIRGTGSNPFGSDNCE